MRYGLLLLLLVLLAPWAGAQDKPAALTEAQVKALYVLNFTKYVEWPEAAFNGAKAPLVIGLVGRNSLDGDLKSIVQGKSVGGRTIEIRTLAVDEDASGCHILFVGEHERRRAGEVLEKLAGRPVLTVGESENFVEEGGVIRFQRKEGSIRLAINPQPAQKAGLKLSSKLLGVAEIVKGKGE
ncbi:MAG: YfiR family protein [Verrucomicrobiota bacterium]